MNVNDILESLRFRSLRIAVSKCIFAVALTASAQWCTHIPACIHELIVQLAAYSLGFNGLSLSRGAQETVRHEQLVQMIRVQRGPKQGHRNCRIELRNRNGRRFTKGEASHLKSGDLRQECGNDVLPAFAFCDFRIAENLLERRKLACSPEVRCKPPT